MKIELHVKLAIAAALICCGISFYISNSLGYYSLSIYGYKFYVSIALLLIGIFLSILLKRKSEEFISFKNALKTGAFFSLIYALIIALYNFLYHKFIAPDVIDFFVSEERKAWLANKRTLEEVNKYLLEYYIPSFGSFHVFMTTLIWGILLSLLFSAILRKKAPALPFSEN